MLEKRRPTALLIALALLPAAQGAAALGWARADQAATLGQPLSFGATLRLDPGDDIRTECVRADVLVGDQQLAPYGIRVDVRRSADALAMRVHTDAAIEEPVVTVTLAVGCPPRLSRRFVLFADPPALASTQQAAAVAQAVPVDVLPPPAAPRAVREPREAPPAAEPRPAPVRSEPPVRSPDAVVGDAPAAAPRAAAEAPPRPRRVAPAPPPARQAEATPRLRLDPVESSPARAAQTATPRVPATPDPAAADTTAATTTATAASAVEDAIAAVSRAASAAEAAAASASAAAARIAALERTVTKLQGEADASRRLVGDLQRRLDAAGGGRLTIPLALTIAALLALAGWLWWRLRALERERQLAWRLAASEAPPVTAMPTTPPPVATIPAPPAAMPTVSPRPTTPVSELPLVTAEIPMPPRAARSPAPGVEGPSERTLVLPTGSRHDEIVAREVSIEELLDLEQQAEFFVVLGQEESAIDLLVQHLRESGGGSPLPYLKLLEIYRRRGDRDAYERTRTRFNQRFNAYAPDWEADLAHGRTLEDYPGVLPRLQQAWGRPLDAMAELEALLFRKSRGELFDLPAYREVLFLYSLARDLLDREAADSGTVDVLLPLAEGESEFGATTPHPYFSLERDASFDPGTAPREPRRTAADLDLDLDLDLSQPAPGRDAGRRGA